MSSQPSTTEAAAGGKKRTVSAEVACTVATLGFAPDSQVLDCKLLDAGRLLVAHGSLVKPSF